MDNISNESAPQTSVPSLSSDKQLIKAVLKQLSELEVQLWEISRETVEQERNLGEENRNTLQQMQAYLSDVQFQ